MKIFKYIPVSLLIISQIGAQTSNEEFRATWVITWEHINPDATPEVNQATVRSIMDNHAAGNMNAVLWQARQSGTAYYQSSYEPWGYYAGYDYPGYDPLAYAIEQAHARGLELHAWFNVFAASSITSGAPAAEHPTWVCRDGNGDPMPAKRALSPGLDSVRAYLVDVAMEIVNNYDIDGLHLDYVRWNEYTTTTVNYAPALGKVIGQEEFPLDGMISPAQLEALNAAADPDRYLYDIDHPYGADPPDSVGGGQFPSWEDWWRWCVTDFVQTLHDSIQVVKPWVRLSPAALGNYNWGGADGWNGYHRVFQDAALWFNEGSVEQLTPMHYHWTTGAGFTGMLTGNAGQNWQAFIQPGIDDGRLFSVGPASYILHDQNRWANHQQIVDACRTVPWVDGFQFFSFGKWNLHQYWEEAGATFFNNKTKIRPTRTIVAVPPAAPALTVNNIDSLTYELTVTPDPGQTGNHWYAIYRSEDAGLDTAADEIVDIHFGSGAYTFPAAFTGTQDYNSRYTYGATDIDRYWNESASSNTVTTDSIPSFAPVVIVTYPAEDDSIAVNASFTITFSKTMDTAALTGALSLSPAIILDNISWSDDHKQATLVWLDNFAYATAYILTIDSTAIDINGVPLDGNGDGVPGDSFTLHFTSKSQDITGPLVLGTYPSANAPTDSIYRDDVITFLFDEHLDPASITETTLVLTREGTTVPTHHKVTNVRSRAVLSVQPLEAMLVPGGTYSLLLRSDLTDSIGNPLDADLSLTFSASHLWTVEEVLLDQFLSTSAWESPDYSGSTEGIDELESTFGLSTDAYLPSARPAYRKAARLHYVWIDTAVTHLLREYMSTSTLKFDTSYVLQCFVFGDGSHNSFRFCLDDGRVTGRGDLHEVSQWIPIDWYGWQLVEWHLGDTAGFGEWIGNGQWDNPTTLYFDSFQLTHEPGASAAEGDIYFSNLRLVKQDYIVTIAQGSTLLPSQFTLYQNYPNPFNPITHIPFTVPETGLVNLIIYDLLGRQVITLFGETLQPGNHTVAWTGISRTGVPVPSGVYFYSLQAGGTVITRRMVLLK